MTLAAVRWIPIPHADDERGTLTVIEGETLPFEVKRIFYMHQVPDGGERGAHAHRFTQQILIAAAGSLTVDVSDGTATDRYELNDPNRGLYLPALTWVHLRDFRSNTVALVLCDRLYVPAHVVRDFEQYRHFVRQAALTA